MKTFGGEPVKNQAAFGNLILHLEENIRRWIIGGVGLCFGRGIARIRHSI